MIVCDKMDVVKLILTVCSVGLVVGTSYDIRLDTIQGEAINGQPFTLKCSVNKTLSFSSVVWMRGDANVLASSVYGFGAPLGNLKSPYGQIWGRYFVTLHGPFDHRLTLLIDPNKDQHSSWRCKASGYESNPVTIQSRAPTPPSFWDMPWIYGLATGITCAVLILTLPVYLRCKKSR